MDIHADYGESATSLLSYKSVNYGKAEDSGYHTLTPGSLECADLSSEDLDRSIISSKAIIGSGQIHIDLHFTPEVNLHLSGRYSHSTAHNESSPDTPTFRRGCKRPHSSTEKIETNSVPTPTSIIAGKIQSLDVNEIKENTGILTQVHIYQHHEYDPLLSYPTTPVKRNCKRNSCRKPGAALNLTMHSLSCESSGLQLQHTNKSRASKAARNIFWPGQKVDIVQKLFQEAGAMPPVTKILSYLSNEDIRNFILVSEVWQGIWKSVSAKNKKKQEFEDFLKTVKGNQENKAKGITPKLINNNPGRCLREIQNVSEKPLVKGPGTTPPASPRTNRFRKFTKSASLDSRMQLSCVRCSQPAKVTEETSGEVWVECTSMACLYQYCKFCKCNRHPGKFCFQYDLNGPSPSKRKKNLYAIGTKKSRRNLLRL